MLRRECGCLTRRFEGKLLERPADFDGPAVAEQAADFPEDHRHGVGRKLEAPALVEPIGGLDQSLAPGLKNIVVFDAAAPESFGARVDKPDVFSDAIPAVSHFPWDGVPACGTA